MWPIKPAKAVTVPIVTIVVAMIVMVNLSLLFVMSLLYIYRQKSQEQSSLFLEFYRNSCKSLSVKDLHQAGQQNFT